MKIARLLPLLLVFGIFISASCQSLKRDQKQAMTAQDDSKLLGRWMRSHEEDKGAQPHIWRNVKTFTFPPARGREGIVFLPDAKCIYLAIAAADGTEEQPGTYGLGWPASSQDNIGERHAHNPQRKGADSR